MRAMVDNFPEVLQMDCTHQTNQYNYQLFTIVAMDQYGQGQPVQYSLIETNGDWHMSKCLDHFKRANEHWRFVRIVIVDKDMREIDVIRKKFPEARILLCHFHVIKWLHETIKKSQTYGAYEAEVLTQMKHTITNMTYSRTEEDYVRHRDEFKSLASRNGRVELWEYFDKNWNACREMWVMAYRVDLPHFGNHTNKRVESLFGKLKRKLKDHLTMRASLEVLLEYQRRKEEAYRSKVGMPGTLRDASYPEELNVALGMTTRWVAFALKTQFDIATNPGVVDTYAFKDNGATITVQSEENEYLLEKEGWVCDCEFSQTMKLPCRHAIVYRKVCGSPFIIPFSSISPRYVQFFYEY
ncbi:secreted protein [Phytophthora sojae]|uniref:Secreted protein n=1 Tax=Phytophthora sojae (strain P6497) TaxID=1094619 RepID=G5A432_PHYSP|nr:secreted protein [Phytophthora sojae]EGZ10339.1 secreted protein [Phytophthora sojae]|eukprot:XP_009535200.1 secreted protein [Phytophthora sojae]